MRLVASLPTIIADSEGRIKELEWKRTTAAWEEMKRVLNAKPDSGGSTVLLQTNGVDNGDQAKLNLVDGTDIGIVDDGAGNVTIGFTGSPSGVAFKTNGVLNALQTVLDLIAGTHVTLTADGAGGVTFDVAWPIIPIVPSTIAKITHKWLDSYDAVTGLFTQSQPDYSDLTGTPTIPAAALYSRGFNLANLATGSSVATHIRAGAAGTINKVTGVLTKAITSNLVMNVYANGNLICTLTIPNSTAVDTVVAVTSFSYTTVLADTIFKISITSSDGSVDPNGIAAVQIWWQ